MSPIRLSSALIGLAFSLCLPAGLHAEREVTRTVRAELPEAPAGGFAVENLAGHMRVTAGSGPAIVVVATIHAEGQALADAVRVEKIVSGDVTTLRVAYPPDLRSIRYPEPSEEISWPATFLFSSGGAYSYGGRTIRVSTNRGPIVFADLEVRMPARGSRARFLNLVGRLDAEGIEGHLRFEVSSADLRLERLGGDVDLHGESGDLRASDISGRFASDSSSGDIRMDGFRGESLSLRTSSGDGELSGVAADRVRVHTSSGDFQFVEADIGELDAESSSGNIELDERGSRLKRVTVEASSGNVEVRLPRDTAFDAQAEQGSGDMEVGFSDGASRRRGDELVGYRRGNGGATIRVKTTSGDLRVDPR
jgi:hypothetical protein